MHSITWETRDRERAQAKSPRQSERQRDLYLGCVVVGKTWAIDNASSRLSTSVWPTEKGRSLSQSPRMTQTKTTRWKQFQLFFFLLLPTPPFFTQPHIRTQQQTKKKTKQYPVFWYIWVVIWPFRQKRESRRRSRERWPPLAANLSSDTSLLTTLR